MTCCRLLFAGIQEMTAEVGPILETVRSIGAIEASSGEKRKFI